MLRHCPSEAPAIPPRPPSVIPSGRTRYPLGIGISARQLHPHARTHPHPHVLLPNKLQQSQGLLFKQPPPHSRFMPHHRFLRLAFAVIALATSVLTKAATWPIEIDGRQVDAPWFALSDTPDKLAIGDVLYVGNEIGGMYVCVRDTKNLVFVNRLTTEALLYRKLEDTLVPVGFRLSFLTPPHQDKTKKGKDDIEAAPTIPKLSDLGTRIIGNLWGAYIDWDADTIIALSHVRPDETFCSLEYRPDKDSPPFRAPSAFRYLDLKWDAPLDESFNQLFSPSLIFLQLSFGGVSRRASLNASSLTNATDLRALIYFSARFENPEALASLKHLRHLDLSDANNLTAAPWLAGMSELSDLNLSHTKLSDLSPLSQLKNLREINLTSTPTTTLAPLQDIPGLKKISAIFNSLDSLPLRGLHRLTNLSVLAAQKLKPSDVDAFKKLHPFCQIHFNWKDELLIATKDADHFVVRSGGTCHRELEYEKILFETKSSAEIAELLALIVIDEAGSNGACMCCGKPTMEFHQGTKLIATVGIQHGHALRADFWPADARLTQKSSCDFTEWLAKRGVTDPRDQVRQSEESNRNPQPLLEPPPLK